MKLVPFLLFDLSFIASLMRNSSVFLIYFFIFLFDRIRGDYNIQNKDYVITQSIARKQQQKMFAFLSSHV